MSESLKNCRYNKNHMVKESRLYIHEQKCPDAINSNLVNCPYNPIHKMKISNLEAHKKTCLQRPFVDQDTEKEMLEYVLKNKNKEINFKQNQKNLENKRENYIPKKNVAGLGPIEDPKEKAERNKERNMLIKLSENISNFDDDFININELNVNINLNLESELNNVNNKQMTKEIVINDKEYEEFDINFYDESRKLVFDESQDYNNEYDPNESDIYINKKNKNNISQTVSRIEYYK